MSVPWTGPLAGPDAIVSVARRAEAAGFGYLQVGDHALYPAVIATPYPYSPSGVMPTDGPKLDVFAVLTFVAAHTSTIGLVPGVYLLALRHPVASARAVATLDFLSGGRVRLGVGSGWMKEEFDILGVAFEERGRIVDEYLAALRHLFEGDGGAFDGRYVAFPPLAFAPRPVQRPLPVLVGGGGSDAVLRRVARFGQGWIPAGMAAADIAVALPRLAAAMRDQGREGEALLVQGRLGKVDVTSASPEEVLERLAELEASGCTGVLVDLGETTGASLPAVHDAIDWFAARIVPHVRTGEVGT